MSDCARGLFFCLFDGAQSSVAELDELELLKRLPSALFSSFPFWPRDCFSSSFSFSRISCLCRPRIPPLAASAIASLVAPSTYDTSLWDCGTFLCRGRTPGTLPLLCHVGSRLSGASRHLDSHCCRKYLLTILLWLFFLFICRSFFSSSLPFATQVLLLVYLSNLVQSPLVKLTPLSKPRNSPQHEVDFWIFPLKPDKGPPEYQSLRCSTLSQGQGCPLKRLILNSAMYAHCNVNNPSNAFTRQTGSGWAIPFPSERFLARKDAPWTGARS